jgi:hypothetical protein
VDVTIKAHTQRLAVLAVELDSQLPNHPMEIVLLWMKFHQMMRVQLLEIWSYAA